MSEPDLSEYNENIKVERDDGDMGDKPGEESISWDGGTDLECSVDNLPERPKVCKTATLDYWHAATFATALEDTLTSLRILSEINISSKISEVKNALPSLIAQKYGVAKREKKELEGVTHKTVNDIGYKYKKIEDDRNMILDVILGTYKDLVESKSYDRLREASMDTSDAGRAYLTMLKNEHVKYKTMFREKCKQLKILQWHHRERKKNINKDIDNMITLIHDTDVMSNIKLRYVKGWQWSRTEQHQGVIENELQSHSNKIEYYKLKHDHEQRIHSESEMIITVLIEDLRAQIDHWVDKYDNDMDEIDLKIQIKKNKYQDIVDQRKKLEEKIVKREEEMKAWIKFKEDRTKARLYRDKMQQSALIVQAWWRGFICRHEYGPFRPPKKKGYRRTVSGRPASGQD